MRHMIEAAAIILWPLLMIPTRGYGDAGTIFGDTVVAAFGVILTECTVHWLRERKRRR